MNWQLIIIVIYFALTMVIGILASRKTKSSDSFVGAGMGVFAIVCVACGQWLGGTATTGCSEYGFTSGISGWWYTLANGIGMLMMGLFFAEKYRKYNSVTIPGIIEEVVCSLGIVVVVDEITSHIITFLPFLNRSVDLLPEGVVVDSVVLKLGGIPFGKLPYPVGVAGAGHTDSFDLSKGALREVDVVISSGPVLRPVLEKLPDNPRQECLYGGKISAHPVITERDPD